MARPASRAMDVHVIPARAESGVPWKIHGCDGGAAWLSPGPAGQLAEIEQSARAAFPADRRRRHPLRRVLGLAGRSPARRALLVPGPGRRRVGRSRARTGPDPGDARPAAARADGCPAFLAAGTPAQRPVLSVPRLPGRRRPASPRRRPVIWFTQTRQTPSPAAISTLSWWRRDHCPGP